MQPNHLPLCTIAGSDPTGGAGLQGDLRAFAALGARGTAVVTAVTVQDRERVSAVHPVPAHVVRGQLEAVLGTRTPAACKTGMLWSADTVRAVAATLAGTGIPLVVDPVLHASVGQPLAERDAAAAYNDALAACTTVVTPNADEAGALLGRAPPAPGSESEDAARALVDLGWSAVVLTGGDATGAEVIDTLAMRDAAETISLEHPRVEGRFHGTGCALSAALAFELARGADVAEALRRARRFVHAAIERAAARGDGWLLRYDA